MSAPAGRQRVAELDGWRGVSILCVVAGHLLNMRYAANPGFEPANLSGVLAHWGVNVFFIVSGFVITRLAVRESAERGRFSVSRFYVRRILRIVPAFYLYLLAIAVFARWGWIDQPVSGTALATAFVCDVPEVPCGAFAEHSWTLSFEEQFYLTFPLLFCLGGGRVAKPLAAILIALELFPVFRFALHLEGVWRIVGEFCPSFSFIAVGALGAAYEDRIKRLASSRYGGWISAGCAGFLLVLLASLVVVSVPLASTPSYFQAALTILVLPPALAWTVLSPVYRGGYSSALLRSRPLQFFGLISYSLYLWQQLFSVEPWRYLTGTSLFFPPLMLVAAVLSYYAVERPCIRAGRRLLVRWDRRAPPRLPRAGPEANEKAIAG